MNLSKTAIGKYKCIINIIFRQIYVQDKVEDDEDDTDTLPIKTNSDLSIIKNKSDSLTFINSPKNIIP